MRCSMPLAMRPMSTAAMEMPMSVTTSITIRRNQPLSPENVPGSRMRRRLCQNASPNDGFFSSLIAVPVIARTKAAPITSANVSTAR